MLTQTMKEQNLHMALLSKLDSETLLKLKDDVSIETLQKLLKKQIKDDYDSARARFEMSRVW